MNRKSSSDDSVSLRLVGVKSYSHPSMKGGNMQKGEVAVFSADVAEDLLTKNRPSNNEDGEPINYFEDAGSAEATNDYSGTDASGKEIDMRLAGVQTMPSSSAAPQHITQVVHRNRLDDAKEQQTEEAGVEDGDGDGGEVTSSEGNDFSGDDAQSGNDAPDATEQTVQGQRGSVSKGAPARKPAVAPARPNAVRKHS